MSDISDEADQIYIQICQILLPLVLVVFVLAAVSGKFSGRTRAWDEPRYYDVEPSDLEQQRRALRTAAKKLKGGY